MGSSSLSYPTVEYRANLRVLSLLNTCADIGLDYLWI